MTELEAQDYQSELETLRSIRPDWAIAPPQPFVSSIQQDVVPARWGKLTLPPPSTGTADGGAQSTFDALVVNNGVLTPASVAGTLGTPL